LLQFSESGAGGSGGVSSTKLTTKSHPMPSDAAKLHTTRPAKVADEQDFCLEVDIKGFEKQQLNESPNGKLKGNLKYQSAHFGKKDLKLSQIK